MPPIERCPTGGYLSRFTTSLASAAVSTCGMTMPSAPLSSARVAIAYWPFGTRAIGAMPASSAAVEICAHASSDITPCSISRNSQSKPATAIALAISTLRVMRTPTPSDSWPCSSFSRATLRTAAGIGFLPGSSGDDPRVPVLWTVRKAERVVTGGAKRLVRRLKSAPLLRFYQDHPRHAEAVGDHAKARREEGFGQRHLHLSAIGEGAQPLFRLGRVGHREGQRDTLEIGVTLAPAVGGPHDRVADAEARMHDLFLRPRRDHAGIGAFLEAHQHFDLGAQRPPVKFEGLFAASVEVQIGLELHCGVPFQVEMKISRRSPGKPRFGNRGLRVGAPARSRRPASKGS